MNKLEFNTLIKELDLPICDVETLRNGSFEYSYLFLNLKIYFGGTYYAVISGDVPFDFANYMYNEYPNDIYHIRVNGLDDSVKPSSWASSYTIDMYKKKIDNYYIDDGDNYVKKYVSLYNVDTKEGLVFFLSEYSRYLKFRYSKNNITSIDDKLLTDINNDFIDDMVAKCSSFKRGKSSFYSLRLLDRFDTFVNPFLNNNLVITNINKDILTSYKNNMNNDNFYFSSFDSSNNILLETSKDFSTISYKVSCYDEKGKRVSLIHTLDSDTLEESVLIKYDGDNHLKFIICDDVINLLSYDFNGNVKEKKICNRCDTSSLNSYLKYFIKNADFVYKKMVLKDCSKCLKK